MSFGNRSNYASLKDAYGITQFAIAPEIQSDEQRESRLVSYTIPEPVEQGPPELPEGKEGFEDAHDDVECHVVKKHCSVCGDCGMEMKRYGPIGTTLNEILNIILIIILLWILIFKPSI